MYIQFERACTAVFGSSNVYEINGYDFYGTDDYGFVDRGVFTLILFSLFLFLFEVGGDLSSYLIISHHVKQSP